MSAHAYRKVLSGLIAAVWVELAELLILWLVNVNSLTTGVHLASLGLYCCLIQADRVTVDHFYT